MATVVPKECIDEIVNALGRKLTGRELRDLNDELDSRIAQRRLDNDLESPEDRVKGAAKDYSEAIAIAASIQKRNAALELNRRLIIVDKIQKNWKPDSYDIGMMAWLVGTHHPKWQARSSAMSRQTSYRDYYTGGLWQEIHLLGDGYWDIFANGALDREIARAMWLIDKKGPIPKDIPKQAQDIAKVVHKWQEIARADANKAGAYIGKIDGYIVRQSHDQWRIRKATPDEWIDKVIDKLDDRTFVGVADRRKFLRQVYNDLASGVHMRSVLKGLDDELEGTVPKVGMRNLARLMSEQRVLHFKSADDWFDYNMEFGVSNLRESVVRGLEMNSNMTGLMEVWGPNPASNFKRVADILMSRLSDEGNIKGMKRFQRHLNGKLKHQFKDLDGTTRLAVNDVQASFFSILRMANRMSKLGGGGLSQIADPVFLGSELRYQGDNLLSATAKGIEGMITGGRITSAEKRRILGELGMWSQLEIGGIHSRFSIADDDVPGMWSKGQKYFFKYNLMTPMTDNVRNTFTLRMSHRLALYSRMKLTNVPPELQRIMRMYGIGDAEWDILRKAKQRMDSGENFITPQAVRELDDNLFKSMIDEGINVTPSRLARAKGELANRMMDMLSDRRNMAVPTPDARVRAFMQRGTQPGTAEGDSLRAVGELKSFPVAVFTNVMGREVYGYGGVERIPLGHYGLDLIPWVWRGIQGKEDGMPRSAMAGIASMFVLTTLLGYVSMTAKDLAKGRTPRDPLSFETFQAATLQGGGLGIYGDFLFGEFRSRFGQGFLTTLMGPTFANVQTVFDLYSRAKAGEDFWPAAVRAVQSNTPFVNLFYTKLIFDYFILWHIQEALNPGALKRLEKRIREDSHQDFLVPPTAGRY